MKDYVERSALYDFIRYIFYLFCSAGSTFPSELEKVFASENGGKGSPRGGLQVCVSKSCAELARQLSPPLREYPLPAPTGEKVGAGENGSLAEQ